MQATPSLNASVGATAARLVTRPEHLVRRMAAFTKAALFGIAHDMLIGLDGLFIDQIAVGDGVQRAGPFAELALVTAGAIGRGRQMRRVRHQAGGRNQARRPERARLAPGVRAEGQAVIGNDVKGVAHRAGRGPRPPKA